VYANLTIALSQVFDASCFRVWGSIYAVMTLLLYSVVFCRTAILINGRIFDAPCLQEPDNANAAVLSSSSSPTTRTGQGKEQDREGEGELTPPPVPVGGGVPGVEEVSPELLIAQSQLSKWEDRCRTVRI
jgi:hypothetical protein